jgi:hypothetical protein
MLSPAPIQHEGARRLVELEGLRAGGADHLGLGQRREAVEQAGRRLAQVALELAEIEPGPLPIRLEPEMVRRGAAGER